MTRSPNFLNNYHEYLTSLFYQKLLTLRQNSCFEFFLGQNSSKLENKFSFELKLKSSILFKFIFLIKLKFSIYL